MTLAEVQECGQGRGPRRHVHLGLAGLPEQPGRLHPAAHRGVSASGEAAVSIRSVFRLENSHLIQVKHLNQTLLYLFTPIYVAQHHRSL